MSYFNRLKKCFRGTLFLRLEIESAFVWLQFRINVNSVVKIFFVDTIRIKISRQTNRKKPVKYGNMARITC